MKKKEKLTRKIARALEIDELVGSSDNLEMRGSNELTVRGCRKILYYSDNEIRLSLKEYVLSIKGSGLYCASYYNGAVRIDGEIDSLEFKRRERKK